MRAASFDCLAILGIPITGRPTTDQTLKYNGTNWTFADLASGGSGDVGGGSNLTTVGAIPYVSAAGTLSQDSALFWDSTSNYLYTGYTNASTYGVRVGVAGAELSFRNGLASAVHSGTVLTWNTSTTAYQWNDNGFNSLLYVKASSTPSVGIGPSNTSPTGTLHVYDATATTGVTTLTVRAGAGQSTTSLLAVQNNAGSNIFLIDSTGAPFASAFYNTAGLSQLSWSLDLFNSGTIRFSSTAQQAGAKDLGLARSSANNLGITNGSSTTYATIGAGGIQMGTDNTYPIGASGSGRPSALFVAGAGTFGGALSVTGGITSSGGGTLTGGILSFNGSGSNIRDTADGRILVMNAAGNDFGRLQFGGTTSAFPAIKRSSTTLQARLADDSAYAPFVSSNLQRGTGAPESAVTGVVGDLFQRTDGGAATSLYLKESGSGNTGWSPLTAVQKNGVYLQVGATNYLMPGLFPVTLPTTSGMSWLANQGTATASTSSTGGALKLNFTTGTSGWRVYGKSISGFTKVTVAVGCPGFADGTSSRSDLEFCGFGLRDSSTGRLQLWHTQNFSGITYFGVSNFTNATTYSGHERINYLNMSLALLYLQVEISGSTAIYRISSDGFNWETVLTTSSFLGTPDEVFVAGQAGSTGDIPMFVYSWKEE